MTVRAVEGPLAVEIDPDHGARLVSFTVAGLELIATQPVPGVPDTITRGSYPMVPWAGRIGHGVVEHGGVRHRLPTADDGNALHGLGRDAVWTQVDDLAFEAELGDPWPVAGTATLRYALTASRLTCTLGWDGAGPGASLGFHPWFRRRLADGSEAVHDVAPERMVERGDAMLPTGRFVEPVAEPWDDCFALQRPPSIRWGDTLTLRLSSDAPWWVVYTRPEHAVCIEPQTAPPDAFVHPSWHRWLDASSITFTLDVEQHGAAGRSAGVAAAP
ncbi:aldose 1-epimerase [Aeromicrobium sp.]|uniref:aldose 1-epimerase n=1 Tax=Aeromicrobium sp. TaxID=1871063 RepID=UPI0040334CEA